jgi:hypothetical protein
VPAVVSASAGVSERYPPELRELLLPDPNDPADLAGRLRIWRDSRDSYRAEVAPLGRALRARTWDRCAADIVDWVSGRA